MFQPLALSIGLRYLRAKRRNGYISFISFASILGIIVGVMTLITTLAVMTGFQEELRNRILGTVSHATISGTQGGRDEVALLRRGHLRIQETPVLLEIRILFFAAKRIVGTEGATLPVLGQIQ